MRDNIFPKSLAGKISMWLAAVVILIFLILPVLTAFGGVGIPVGFTIGVVLGVAGIGALLFGVFSLVKSKERSALVFLSVLIGILVALFFLGELIFPH